MPCRVVSSRAKFCLALSCLVLSCLVFSDTIKFDLCDLMGPAYIDDGHPEKLRVGVKVEVRIRTRGTGLGLELG